jgi:hypothetical protein
MRKVLRLLPMVLVALGCGGGTPTPTTSSSSSPDAAMATTSEPVDAGPPHESIESKRDIVVQQCLTKLNAPAYCNCAFDQFADVFKDADLSVPPTETQLTTVRQRTTTTCTPKLTDEAVKQAFTATCVTGDTRKAPYCDCLWPSLRKTLGLVDFIGDFEGQRFDDAKKAAAVACKGKLPEEVAKTEFIGGCTKAAPAQDKACECVWKKLRTKATVEEIVGGVVDMKTAGLEVCKPK